MFPMPPVETLGQAFAYGWRIHARCGFGPQDDMKRIREEVRLLYDVPSEPKRAVG